MNITPELKREGVAREISRFLNQMRKDADYQVDKKIKLTYSTDDAQLKSLIHDFADFFQHEALITDIKEQKWKLTGDIVALFESDGKNVEFSLSK